MSADANRAEAERRAAVEKALAWAAGIRKVTTGAPLGFGPSDSEKMLMSLADEVARLRSLVRAVSSPGGR